MCSIEWLVGRVAVVTGAASGIGLALTEAFLGAGTQVVMADFDGQRLAEQSERLRDGGAGPIDVVTDVSSWGDVEALAGRAVDAFGTVDVLVNNAGTIAFGVAWEIPLEDWERVIGVNLRSMIYGARAFVPHMRASGDDGVIINLASMAAFTTHGSIAPYVTTKHGVVGLSEALSADLHAVGSGISVSAVCPGMVATGFGRPEPAPEPDADLPEGVLSPGAVAATIIDATIGERRAYVFTHDDSPTDVRQRYDRILGTHS